jgi:hypothetical protein
MCYMGSESKCSNVNYLKWVSTRSWMFEIRPTKIVGLKSQILPTFSTGYVLTFWLWNCVRWRCEMFVCSGWKYKNMCKVWIGGFLLWGRLAVDEKDKAVQQIQPGRNNYDMVLVILIKIFLLYIFCLVLNY